MDQPSFEGRPLPRPEEEVFDQGLAFDLETMNRRRALRYLGIGASAAALAACGGTTDSASTSSTSAVGASSSSSTSTTTSTTASGDLTEIPDETAGPYPGDGSNGPNVLTEDGVVRQDITTSFGDYSGTAEGVPATIELTILDMANGNAAFAGVAVYVWHCNRDGNYSLYSDGITDQNYLRGVQVADDSGKVSFTSIFPACYSGRWPHIHFEVYPDQASITDSSKAIATSQIAIPQAQCEEVYATTGYEQSVTNLSQLSLATDNVFSDDSGATQLATMSGSVDKGYTIALTAAVDTTTEPTGGSAPK
ncbi:intradiol ring-cleavage dioxygenase [Nostocoides jenkinsii]|uniref:Intradiol ring-cleavage dioxygenase n=1 Tax=Nostocoides jenkinsii Ben 74 TaxID=1193518 RepID=A0A077M988_9MICO|nr:intradiol ring-cleavage dioxygenase [Tetrasphaera jenkinsii]CCI51293.1 Intradiol ring-cleavage dioxygenase [Tetrasphaera jenkinsii Ben 74]